MNNRRLRISPNFFLLLASFILSLGLGQATSKEPLSKESEGTTLEKPVSELPQWTKEDRSKVIRGELTPGEDLLPTNEEGQTGTGEFSLIVQDKDLIENDEDPTTIPKELLPEYLPTDQETFIIDPQNLLTETERNDIEKLLSDIKETTTVTPYLTVFNTEQIPPANLNAPALARHLFGEKEKCVLIQYNRLKPALTQVVFSNDLARNLSDNKKKFILDSAYRQANLYTFDYEIIWQIIDNIGSQLNGILRLSQLNPVVRKLEIPKVSITLPTENAKEKTAKKLPFSPDKIIDQTNHIWSTYIIPIGIIVIIIILILIGYTFYKSHRKYDLTLFYEKSTDYQKHKSLKSPIGIGTTRPYKYGNQHASSKHPY